MHMGIHLLPGLIPYGVSPNARTLVEFMRSALKSAGCRILFCSSVDEGPFVITFETATDERLGIVAYAFRSARSRTGDHYIGERAFHLAYGSQSGDVLQHLWTDPLSLFTTLYLAVDPIEDIFVSADPASDSAEEPRRRLNFKDEHLDAIRATSWHAWERTGRRAEERVEVLVGCTKDRFLDLIRFERAAVGLSAGHRHLLADKTRALRRSWT